MSFIQHNRFSGWCLCWVVVCLCGGINAMALAEPNRSQQAAPQQMQTRPQQIVVPPWGGGNSHDDYFYRLLNLIFSKTEATYGVAEVVPFPENLTATRFTSELKQNKSIHLVWHGTSQFYERELLAIPISVTKELNEYRVLLIRKEDQAKFSTVKTVADLRKFVAGSGADWPAREVMLSNDLPVLGVTNTSLLFNMLKAKRFDYISRNLFEMWGEADRYSKEGLVLEQTLLIRGSRPFYFFVSKANPKLAQRIERGLKIAMADGSFEALFFSDEGMRRGQQELEKGRRRLLRLNTNYSSAKSELPSSH